MRRPECPLPGAIPPACEGAPTWRPRLLSAEGGIYLTQVGWQSAADRQGLAGLVRGAAGVVSRRGCVSGLSGVAALAGRVPLSTLRESGWLAFEQRSLGVCGLPTAGVGHLRDDLPSHSHAAAVVVRGCVGDDHRSMVSRRWASSGRWGWGPTRRRCCIVTAARWSVPAASD